MLEQLISEDSLRRFSSLLAQKREIVLTCHVRPDGDAVGSTLGLMHLLRALGHDAHVVMPDTPPRSLSFLPGFGDIVAHSKYPDYASRLMADAQVVIACDFNGLKRQDEMAPLWQNLKATKVMIDHHEGPEPMADITFSYPHMSSTCELAFRIIAGMGLYEKMNLDAATCLATGIITDTRNLTVNVGHLDLYFIMVELLRKGVPKRLILKETLETKSYDALRLCSFALSQRLEIFPQHRAAIVSLSQKDLQQFHYEKGDTEGLVNQALELRGIIYVAFLREDTDKVKVSMRSLGDFPVNKVCADLFDGGGHRQAAGGDYSGSLKDAIKRLTDAMPSYDPEMKQAAESLSGQGYILS